MGAPTWIRGERKLLDTTGKKSVCPVSLSFPLLAFHISRACSCASLVAPSLDFLLASLLSYLGCIFVSVIFLKDDEHVSVLSYLV